LGRRPVVDDPRRSFLIPPERQARIHTLTRSEPKPSGGPSASGTGDQIALENPAQQ
jgi:hypothetical protein